MSGTRLGCQPFAGSLKHRKLEIEVLPTDVDHVNHVESNHLERYHANDSGFGCIARTEYGQDLESEGDIREDTGLSAATAR